MSSRNPDITLAPLGPEDAARLLRWMQDPIVAAGIGLKTTPTLEKTRAFIERARAAQGLHAFAILEGAPRRHVGNVVLDEIDHRAGSARLSIYLGETDARGRGLGTTAVRHALAAAFGPLGLHRVWLTVHAKNAAAIAAYRRAGFVVEGTLREAFWLDGGRVDALLMARLATDPAPEAGASKGTA